VSSLLFAVVHLSADAWLNLWYLAFAIGTALVTWRTGGIEIAVVLHAMYNTLTFVLDAALRTDLTTVLSDRGEGAANAAVLIPIAVVLGTAAAGWFVTRRTGPLRTLPGETA
jgi:hypothetical protein